jgi:hypothetical protein
LKFKHCHGDEEKRKRVGEIANLAMAVLVQHRRRAAKLISEHDCNITVGQCQERIMDMLDEEYDRPDTVPETPEAVEDNEQPVEEYKEPEVGGAEKLSSIREQAGIGRCPTCLGVMLVNETQCYKCRKDQ